MVNIIKNIGKKILKSSNSIEYYKKKIKKQDKEIKKLKKEVNKLKKNEQSTNVLFNSILIDYKLVPKTFLQNLQDLHIEMLIFLDNICKKYDLHYIIEGGTLLGAVRHGGFIPWDDDLDTGMMREDFNKLCDILPYELERNGLKDDIRIFFKKRELNGEVVETFLQLFYHHDEPYWVDFAGLDVFPYDYKKEYNGEDIGELYEKERINYYTDLINKVDRDIRLEKYYKNLDLTYEKTNYVIQGVEGLAGPNRAIKLNVFDMEKILPLKRIPFENIMVPAPKDPDYYLKLIYGYYIKIPKSIHIHGRINRLRTYPNVNEIYTEYINKMKTVNKNFFE